MEKIRKHFYFSGRVQGVGFRYRSYYIAQSMGLTGWVRNLWDDRVEMEVQGTREEIREMVERLSQQSFVEIEGIEAREIPLDSEFGFHDLRITMLVHKLFLILFGKYLHP